MSVRGYAFDAETVDRLFAMLDAWESRPGGSAPKPRRGRPTAANVQRLRVTNSTAAGTVAGVTYYHVRTRQFDPTAGTWSDLFTYDDAFVFSPTGATFSEDDELDAKAVGSVTVSGQTRPAFAAISGGTVNVSQVKITSWACKDHAGITACNGGPSPHCYYPGVLQTLTCAGWTAGINVWVVFTLENMLTPVAGVGGAPPTLVVVDGNTRVMAKDEGFTYAPDNGGTTPPHPNNGESRPVWSSDFYAAGQALDCVDGLTLGGDSG